MNLQRRRKKLVNPLEKSRLHPTGSTPQSQNTRTSNWHHIRVIVCHPQRVHVCQYYNSCWSDLQCAIGGSDNVRTRHSQHSDEQPHRLSFSHISGSSSHTTGIWIWELPPLQLEKEFWDKSRGSWHPVLWFQPWPLQWNARAGAHPITYRCRVSNPYILEKSSRKIG